MTFDQELLLLLKARYPIIYIKTIEEDRVELLIRRNVKINLNKRLKRPVDKLKIFML